MTLKLIKPDQNVIYDISNAVESVTWSGSILSAGRSVEFTVLNDPYDSGLKIPAACVGDYISFLVGSEELFYGQIFSIERSTAIGTITYTAYDMMKNLLESNGRYNFKNTTPEAIAAQVLADIQVPYNHLEPTGINIKSMICDSKAFYDIIMGAYTQAYRITGNRYLPMIWQRAFGVWPAVYTVGNFTLSDELNVAAASISETMDGIKNTVKIYDDKGNQVGEIKDDTSLQKFGTFQDVYTVESNNSGQKHVKGKSDTEHIFVGYRRQKLSQRLLRGREGCGYRTIWKILDQDGQAHLAGRHVPDGAGAVF